MDVAATTLVQRVAPPGLPGRVFGSLYGGIGVAAALPTCWRAAAGPDRRGSRSWPPGPPACWPPARPPWPCGGEEARVPLRIFPQSSKGTFIAVGAPAAEVGDGHPSCANGRRNGAGGDDAPGDGAGAGRASGAVVATSGPARQASATTTSAVRNGGYDVKHYLLKVSYDPATDRLVGGHHLGPATQNLSSFNLDFVGLTVRSIKVNGRSASWSRTDHCHRHPQARAAQGRKFTTVVRDGVPITQEIARPRLHHRGRLHPHRRRHRSPASPRWPPWFPVNDHPIDKASYTFVVTAPADLEVVANGRLLARKRHGGRGPGCGTPPSRWPRTWPR